MLSCLIYECLFVEEAQSTGCQDAKGKFPAHLVILQPRRACISIQPWNIQCLTLHHTIKHLPGSKEVSVIKILQNELLWLNERRQFWREHAQEDFCHLDTPSACNAEIRIQ